MRTFGQHLAHVANYNYLWCAEAKGEKNPNAGVNLEKTLTTKDQIMKGLRASYDYCDGAYSALTEANASEVITITQESGRQVQQTRTGLLLLNIVHNEEALRKSRDHAADQEHRAAIFRAAPAATTGAVGKAA